MHIHTHIHTYIHANIHVYTCMQTETCIYVYIYTYIYLCTYTCICDVHALVCVYVCIFLYVVRYKWIHTVASDDSEIETFFFALLINQLELVGFRFAGLLLAMDSFCNLYLFICTRVYLCVCACVRVSGWISLHITLSLSIGTISNIANVLAMYVCSKHTVGGGIPSG